jgi:ABC-type branched-subunit amino acid transport system substrate-binding protein
VETVGVFLVYEMTIAESGSADYFDSVPVPVVGVPTSKVWSDHLNMNSWVYLSNTDDDGYVTTIGDYARAQGGTRAVVIANDAVLATRDRAEDLDASFRSAGIPSEIVEHIPGASGLDRTARLLVASGADVVAGALDARDFADVLVAARRAGAQITVPLTIDIQQQEVLATHGAAVAGLTGFLTTVPFEADTPAHEQYLADMARYAPGLPNPEQQVPFAAYIAADLMVRGLEAAGPCPSRSEFLAALRGVDDFDADGLLPGPIDVGANHGQINRCFTFLRVDAAGTGYEVVPGAERICGEPLPTVSTATS